jgi:DNA-binding transcriptional regulator YiaG
VNKKYESEALMVSHQAAQDLFELGVIDADRMREFDGMCLVHEPEPAEEAAAGSLFRA